MQTNSVSSLSSVSRAAAESPSIPIPPPKSGALYAGLFKYGDDYCGNGKIPIPLPHGGGPLAQFGVQGY